MVPYDILDMPQRSPEWFAARAGRLTGSVAADMLATIKSGEAAARRNLRIALVLERLTGKTDSGGFVTAAMQQGIDREPFARLQYEALTGELVSQPGFIQCRDIMAGVSLDGCVMDGDRIQSIQEFKCPEPSAHLDVLKTKQVPAKYLPQIYHGLWITGASWCDWMSYNPDFPDGLQAVLIQVDRRNDALEDYAAKALAFLDEVDREYALVKGMVA